MRKTNRDNGFTLIEMIISVALLAVAGVAVASLFLNAQVNNMKAADLDHSTSLCSSFIEEIKAAPEAWIKGESGVKGVKPVKFNPGSYAVYYDDSWQIITDDALPAGTMYMIRIDLYGIPEKPGLYSVETRAVRLKPYPLSGEGNAEILKLSTMTEYPGEVGP